MADPKVGPADPKVVHEQLQKRFEEEKDYRNSHPILPNVSQTGAHPEAHRELRRGPEGKTIMESVDSAVRGK